jgi:hypothetical protein
MRHAAELLCFVILFGVPAMWAQDAPKPSMPLLLRSIWRITQAERQPFDGSIYIFLPNGTLLETSCGEPYRIALWSRDSQETSTLRITEDQSVVATWKIVELTATTLRLEKKMSRSDETEHQTLTAVREEFVCPDLPK